LLEVLAEEAHAVCINEAAANFCGARARKLHAQDEEVAAVAVMELGGSRGGAGAGRDATCECTSVDRELFSSRPGLRILQITWHPGAHPPPLPPGPDL